MLLKSGKEDAQVVFWGPEDDVKTALETIEERCLMAFDGVPEETRKSFANGTTIFERVLPGADRMYPDTDSAPIPLADSYIEDLRSKLPTDVIVRYNQLIKWNVPEDAFTYIFKKNLYPLIEKIYKELDIAPRFIGGFLGHKLKFVEGHFKSADHFKYNTIYAMFKYLKDQNITIDLAEVLLSHIYTHPKMQFDSVLNSIHFKRQNQDSIFGQIPFLHQKFQQIGRYKSIKNEQNWIMGQLRGMAIGNIPLVHLTKEINQQLKTLKK